jgi:hypothetical protein
MNYKPGLEICQNTWLCNNMDCKHGTWHEISKKCAPRICENSNEKVCCKGYLPGK